MLLASLVLGCGDNDSDTGGDGSTDDGGSTADGGTTDGGTSDGGTTWAGTWSGDTTLSIEEGGFALAKGTCAVTLAVAMPADPDTEPLGSGSFTCAPAGMSSAEWTFRGATRHGSTWAGDVAIDVAGWAASSTAFSATLHGDTLQVVVPRGTFSTGGEWYYSWGVVTVDLRR